METKKAYIREDLCIGCGACISVCPAHAVVMKAGWKSEVDDSKCVGCGRCAAICHRDAPILLSIEGLNEKNITSTMKSLNFVV